MQLGLLACWSQSRSAGCTLQVKRRNIMAHPLDRSRNPSKALSTNTPSTPPHLLGAQLAALLLRQLSQWLHAHPNLQFGYCIASSDVQQCHMRSSSLPCDPQSSQLWPSPAQLQEQSGLDQRTLHEYASKLPNPFSPAQTREAAPPAQPAAAACWHLAQACRREDGRNRQVGDQTGPAFAQQLQADDNHSQVGACAPAEWQHV